jgi:LAO/AO transport system kinase
VSEDVIGQMLDGDAYALSRLITMVESDSLDVHGVLKRISDRLGNAYYVGITGPPGAGKSSLVAKLSETIRKTGATVGIIACDPSSPLSGGAVLGDRIRMERLFLDEGVYIRSMATRGNLGGLARKVDLVAKLLDSFGKDFIILETVGVGQTETEIRSIADTTLLVLTPMCGDYIQAMKSGINEIANIFAINKIDVGEAGVIAENIASVLAMRIKPGSWRPRVLKTQAVDDIGIEEVLEAIKEHRGFINETGLFQKKREENRKREFYQVLRDKFQKRFEEFIERDGCLGSYVEKTAKGQIDPYVACEAVIRNKDVWTALFSQLTEDMNERGNE